MPIAEVADRYTITMLKNDYAHARSQPTESIEEYQQELEGVDVRQLIKINTAIWHIEDLITKLWGVEQIGSLYLALRSLNKDRIEEKNKIAAEHGGPMERKNY